VRTTVTLGEAGPYYVQILAAPEDVSASGLLDTDGQVSASGTPSSNDNDGSCGPLWPIEISVNGSTVDPGSPIVPFAGSVWLPLKLAVGVESRIVERYGVTELLPTSRM
jgi:hypothetical protein